MPRWIKRWLGLRTVERPRSTVGESIFRASRHRGVHGYCEYNERRTQRSNAHELIEFPSVCVTERELLDDEEQRKFREMLAAVHNAMQPEEVA